jgi:hypothetical protein
MSGVYLSTSCDCSNNIQVGCSNNNVNCDVSGNQVNNALRIYQDVVRMPSSLYRMKLASVTVSNNRMSTWATQAPLYNQSSDRCKAHTVPTYTPRSRMKLAPGVSSANGSGVDIKHNSYDRYLARRKGNTINHQNRAGMSIGARDPLVDLDRTAGCNGDCSGKCK